MTNHEMQRLATRVRAAQERAERAREQHDYAGAAIAEGDARRYMRRMVAEQSRRADARSAAA